MSELLTDDERWARLRDRMFVALAAFGMCVMAFTSFVVIRTNQTVGQLNQNQVAIVQQQNDAQICTQHDIVLAVKSIGRKLGLPVDDITVPDVKGLDCP